MSQMEHNLKELAGSLTNLVNGMKLEADKYIKDLQKNADPKDAEIFAKAMKDNDVLNKATDAVNQIMKDASNILKV